MHDLNTIARLNAQAFADAIQTATGQGRYVVATYTGLHLQSIATFDNRDLAVEALAAPFDDPSQHRALHTPRNLTPDLGPSPHTLGAYVQEKYPRGGNGHGY